MISSLYLTNPTTQASDSRYFQYDGLGSVIGRTNQQGNTVSNYSYEAFGAITSQKGQDSNSYTYMGQAYDSSTGLYYFNARWYDASIGRFISADPLPGNPFQSGSTNRYAYALDNPIAYEDVSGLSARGLDTHIDNALNDLYYWMGIGVGILGGILLAMLSIGVAVGAIALGWELILLLIIGSLAVAVGTLIWAEEGKPADAGSGYWSSIALIILSVVVSYFLAILVAGGVAIAGWILLIPLVLLLLGTIGWGYFGSPQTGTSEWLRNADGATLVIASILFLMLAVFFPEFVIGLVIASTVLMIIGTILWASASSPSLW